MCCLWSKRLCSPVTTQFMSCALKSSLTSFTLVLFSQLQFLSSFPVLRPSPIFCQHLKNWQTALNKHICCRCWEAFAQILMYLYACPAGFWGPGYHPKVVVIKHQEPRGKAFPLPPPFIFGGCCDAEQCSYTSLLQLSWTSCLSY